MNKITLIIVVLSFVFSNGLYAQSFVQTGKASFYANKFENKTTASGEKYQHSLLTAAHKTLPFGTIVKITNISNGKTVTVKINDRGPFVEDRIIDVSKSAAVELDFVNEGITEVRIETVENQETIDSRAEIEEENLSTTDINTENGTGEFDTTLPSQKGAVSEQKSVVAPQVSTAYYQLSAERTIPRGFGVQIASYQESVNLIERVSTVANELKQKVTIQIVNSNGTRIYRLIVGEFDTRAKAEFFKDSIKPNYQGFVVTF